LRFLPACRAGISVCPSFALFYVYCSIHTLSDCRSVFFVFLAFIHAFLPVRLFLCFNDLTLGCPCCLSTFSVILSAACLALHFKFQHTQTPHSVIYSLLHHLLALCLYSNCFTVSLLSTCRTAACYGVRF
jgi:hypothetical protein